MTYLYFMLMWKGLLWNQVNLQFFGIAQWLVVPAPFLTNILSFYMSLPFLQQQ